MTVRSSIRRRRCLPWRSPPDSLSASSPSRSFCTSSTTIRSVSWRYIKEDAVDSHRKSAITGAFKDGAGNPVTGAGEIAANSDALSAKEKWELDKQRAAQERKLKADIAKIEKRIEEIEARDAEIDEELVKEEVFTDPKKLLELNNEKKALESENEELMEKWEELSQSLEDF